MGNKNQTDDWLIPVVNIVTREEYTTLQEEKIQETYKRALVNSRKVSDYMSSELKPIFEKNKATFLVNASTANEDSISPKDKIFNWVFHQIINDGFYGLIYVHEEKQKSDRDARKTVLKISVSFTDERDYKAFELGVLFGSKLSQE